MRVKGKVVAQLTITFDYEDNRGYVRPFTEVKSHIVDGKLAQHIQAIIKDEIIGGLGNISVSQTEAELYQEENNA